MITGVQILGIAFGLFMFYYTFLHHKRKEFDKLQYFFWEIVWLLLILIAIFPQFLSAFTKKLGFVRLFDFLMVSAFIILTFITFYNYLMMNKTRKNLEEQVREEALKSLDKK